jgi:hypothetical protein
LNIFFNFFLLLFFQKDNHYESFLNEKTSQKISDTVILKTAIILSIVTNTTVLLVTYITAEILIFVETNMPKTPKERLYFTIYG